MSKTRVNFRLPEELIEKADLAAEVSHKNRTEIVVEALREYLDEMEDQEQFREAVVELYLDDRIGFDDFQELDIRIGRIEDAEGIEGADDLLKLRVDLGAETRTIVAGLKQLHDVDELPGTKVVVLANMEKAELFGVQSNGMVLAAGEEADLLTTYEDAGPGTKVK